MGRAKGVVGFVQYSREPLSAERAPTSPGVVDDGPMGDDRMSHDVRARGTEALRIELQQSRRVLSLSLSRWANEEVKVWSGKGRGIRLDMREPGTVRGQVAHGSKES